MKVLMPFGHAVSKQLFSRPGQLLTRLSIASRHVSCRTFGSDSNISRVNYLSQRLPIQPRRTYATGTASKPAGRPKGHTGRAAPKKRTTGVRSRSKQSAAGRGTSTKKKGPARKKAKKTKKPKKVLSAAATARRANNARRQKQRDLKETALLHEPKKLPESAWLVFFQEKSAGSKGTPFSQAANRTRGIAQDYRDMSAADREHYNHVANENAARNKTEHQKWVSQYTPLQIEQANNARRQLAKIKQKQSKSGRKQQTSLIQDDRRVKRPASAYSLFTRSRWASGDFKSVNIGEAGKLIGREWKALSASEKQPFEDQALAEHNRYAEEVRTVYGRDIEARRPKRS